MYVHGVYICVWETDRGTERVGVSMPQPIGKGWTTTLWRHFPLPTVTWLLRTEFTYSPWATLLGPSVIVLTSWPWKMPLNLCLLSASWMHNNVGVSSFLSLFMCTSPGCHLQTIWEQCFQNSSQIGAGYLGNVWIHQAWHQLAFSNSDWLCQAAFNGGYIFSHKNQVVYIPTAFSLVTSPTGLWMCASGNEDGMQGRANGVLLQTHVKSCHGYLAHRLTFSTVSSKPLPVWVDACAWEIWPALFQDLSWTEWWF